MKHLLLLLTLLLISFPAQASKPDAYTNEYGYADEIVDCGDFSIWDDVWVVENVKDFYDKDGNFIRSDMKITGYDDLYRFDDVEGVHLTGTAHIMGRVSFDGNGDMLWTQSGLAVAIIVPGHGPIFLDVGRLVYNMDDGWDLLFSAGSRHDWNFGEFEALCNYFDQD